MDVELSEIWTREGHVVFTPFEAAGAVAATNPDHQIYLDVLVTASLFVVGLAAIIFRKSKRMIRRGSLDKGPPAPEQLREMELGTLLAGVASIALGLYALVFIIL